MNSILESPDSKQFTNQFIAPFSNAMRLGKSYWIQTPSNYFPMDPHAGVFLY
jgi:hypothetical protein